MTESADPDYILRGFDDAVSSLLFLATNMSSGAAESVSLSAAAVFLLVGTQSGSVYVCDLHRRRTVHSLLAIHQGSLLTLAAVSSVNQPTDSEPGRTGAEHILTHGRDGIIFHWKLSAINNWQQLGCFRCCDHGFSRLSLLKNSLQQEQQVQQPQQPLVAIPSTNTSLVDILAIDSGRTLFSLKPQVGSSDMSHNGVMSYGMVMDIKCTSEGLAFVGYENGCVCVWDTRQTDAAASVPGGATKLHDEAVASLDYSECTARGVSGSVDGSLVVWDGPQLKMTCKTSVNGSVCCVAARSDGKLFVVGASDSRVYVYCGNRKLSLLVAISAHSLAVQSAVFNNVNKTFAVGSRDKTVSIWSLYT